MKRISSTVSITLLPRPDSVHIDFNLQPVVVPDTNTFDNLNVQNVVSGGASAKPLSS